jgi:hypothetical protein
MKIEFVKELLINGNFQWSTEIDGHYVANSLSNTEATARAFYEKIVQGKGVAPREVIDSVDIPD